MKPTRTALVAFLILAIVAVVPQLFAAGSNSLEEQVVRAKAAYRAAPTPANLAAVEAAVAAFEAADPHIGGDPGRAIVTETEPNDTSGTADPITNNTDRGTGDLMPAGDRDWWSISGASVGDLLFVLLDSGASGTGTDVEMSVFETDGTTLIEFDDDSGDGLGSAVAAIVPTAGSIIAELNEFGDNGTIEPYNVFMSAIAPGAATAETEPNDTTGTAEGLPGTVTTGDLGDATADVFFFNASAGDRIGLVVNNDPDADASNADAECAIIDPDGITTLASETPFSVTGQNACAATAVNSGHHFVRISDGGSGTDTDYSLVIWLIDAPVPVELQSFAID